MFISKKIITISGKIGTLCFGFLMGPPLSYRVINKINISSKKTEEYLLKKVNKLDKIWFLHSTREWPDKFYLALEDGRTKEKWAHIYKNYNDLYDHSKSIVLDNETMKDFLNTPKKLGFLKMKCITKENCTGNGIWECVKVK